MGCGSSSETAKDQTVQPDEQQQQQNVLSVEETKPNEDAGRDKKPKKTEPGTMVIKGVKMTKAQQLLAKRRQEEREEEERAKKGVRGNRPVGRNIKLIATNEENDKVEKNAATPNKAKVAGAVAVAASTSKATTAPISKKEQGGNDFAQSASFSQPQRMEFSDKDFEGFKCNRMLGKGSFGTTFEAGLKRGVIVCVKVIELGGIAEKEDLDELKNEITLMKKFEHPNIVRYYGCSENVKERKLNIFMEYCTGGSLNNFIKKFHNIEYTTAREWTKQICLGVKYLHDNGVVHRDIKGANILIAADSGQVKLADFGCSKAIDETMAVTHGCSTFVGTPYFMAPEIVRGENYGYPSDIWSIGCTVVELITGGKPPWPITDNMFAAVYKIANSTGLPPSIPTDISSNMKSFLEKCFEREQKKRASIDTLLSHPWLQES